MSILTKINKLPSGDIVIVGMFLTYTIYSAINIIIIIIHIPMWTHKLRMETWKV